MSKIEMVDCKTLKEWLDKDEAVVIDVREIAEYDAAHIKDAILIPVGTCSTDTVPHTPGKKIVFHCKAGLRGSKACEICAKGLPETTVYNLQGGLDAWIAQGYPVQKSA
ncbi:MAG: rhodanese-like domain-containing protein [Pseudomonadota bacterium]|jgi:rhodanese-related sulfurtransferase|nr:rhodanese-like domain-containing protein [Pseudomonadota bacterium]QKK05630.1 MAG: rhodanese-like domain-containing protein [Pseudomonadota bacterium]